MPKPFEHRDAQAEKNTMPVTSHSSSRDSKSLNSHSSKRLKKCKHSKQTPKWARVFLGSISTCVPRSCNPGRRYHPAPSQPKLASEPLLNRGPVKTGPQNPKPTLPLLDCKLGTEQGKKQQIARVQKECCGDVSLGGRSHRGLLSHTHHRPSAPSGTNASGGDCSGRSVTEPG